MVKSLSIFLVFFVLGCAHFRETNSIDYESDGFRQAHLSVQRDLEARSGQTAGQQAKVGTRDPATDESVEISRAYLNNLNSVVSNKVKSFSLVVVPKFSTDVMKTREQDKFFGKPYVIEAKLILSDLCSNILSRPENFKKISAAKIFGAANIDFSDRQLRCAVVEFTDTELSENKPMQSAGDILQYRLYFDSAGRVYGHETVFSDGQRSSTVQTVANVDQLEVSSGLSSIPIDLPPMQLTSGEFVGHFSSRVKVLQQRISTDKFSDSPHILAAIKKVAKKFTLTSCNGYDLEYRDRFGITVKMGICPNSPWPNIIETSRAITFLYQKPE